MSEQEFRRVYDAHAGDLLRFLVRRVDQPEDAADLLSEVFLVWWRRNPDLPPDEVRPWLFGVARKVLAGHDRGVRRKFRLAAALAVTLRDGPPSVADESVLAVTQALERLPKRDREVLQLTCWDGLTPAEIAVVIGIRPAAVRVRLHRARERLRELLDAQDAPDPDATAVSRLTGVTAPQRWS